MNSRWTLRLSASLLVFCIVAAPAAAQVSLSNPNWNMTLTSAGYSDLLLDNTPGYEGREYLSGEWGAAVSYRRGDGASAVDVTPTWLEANFIYPDWTTNSNFTVIDPIAVTTTSADGFDIGASSTLANSDLRVNLNFQMVDTVAGMKMGTSPASASTGGFIDSNRYVMQQSYTFTNISGETIHGLNAFQFLHGLHGATSAYDDRSYGGPLGEYRYDTTQVAVDPTYSGSGSTFRDYIGFGSKLAPTKFDNGYYGIEGTDDHVLGKPSVGVHLAIEGNALVNVDYFNPGVPWVGGAQQYALGDLAAGQSVSFDVLLSIRTGTVISNTGGVDGSANGGSSVAGGVDFHCDEITTPGALFVEYSRADAQEIAERIAEGEFTSLTFAFPGDKLQLYEVEFDGEFSGLMKLAFGYDPTLLPAGFDESNLVMYHFTHGVWEEMTSLVDSLAHTITVETASLSPFAIGGAEVPEVSGANLTATVFGFAALWTTIRRRRDGSARRSSMRK